MMIMTAEKIDVYIDVYIYMILYMCVYIIFQWPVYFQYVVYVDGQDPAPVGMETMTSEIIG